jgi:hypothetical protein
MHLIILQQMVTNIHLLYDAWGGGGVYCVGVLGISTFISHSIPGGKKVRKEGLKQPTQLLQISLAL